MNKNIEILDELLPELMEKSLSPEQKTQLDKILASDEEARQYYHDYIDTHISLDWHFAGNSLELPSGLEPVIGNDQEEVKPVKSFPFPLVLLSAAAAIVIAFVLPTNSSSNSYKVINSVSAVWANDGKSFEVGDSISTKKLNLKEGYSELETAEGVKLIVEGPAEFELVSNKEVILNKGKLVAYVPDKNTGFKVHTPQTEVLDLGTEFGVSVGQDGDTEVHVLEGQVETTSAGKKTLVNKSEAEFITKQKSVLAKADAGRFMRILPEKTDKDVSFIRWSFDEGQGEESVYRGKNLPEEDFNAYLKSTYKDGPKPKWIDGKYGKALNFDATGGYLETGYPGIGGAKARTVSFWVKIPKGAVEFNAVSMIAWGSYAGKGRTWQVAWNWKPEDGAFGALRAGLYHGQIVGSKDLRDGEWHHVAVVMFGGQRANVNTHILLYVDGQLEPASRKSILDVKTDIESKKAIKVLMGRNALAHVKGNEKHKVFNGSMDEVYIFDCALDEEQIRRLMKYNKSGLE
ncbi:MAG: FecR domain-containing protein [Lentisphaeraceae bacterium]|nr:FecR domain-containing protein [Lentisphaeraceae bacterium]